MKKKIKCFFIFLGAVYSTFSLAQIEEVAQPGNRPDSIFLLNGLDTQVLIKADSSLLKNNISSDSLSDSSNQSNRISSSLQKAIDAIDEKIPGLNRNDDSSDTSNKDLQKNQEAETNPKENSTGPSFYQVELAKGPPVKAFIERFEGHFLTPIIAPDIRGQQLELVEMMQKPLLLIFCSFLKGADETLIAQFSEWKYKLNKEILIVFLADETKDELNQLFPNLANNVHLIGDCRLLSEAVYAKEIGNPRLFYVDPFGTIRKVFQPHDFHQIDQLFHSLDLLMQ
ncbi:MAG TPA: hypothetical protein PK006_09965 [Saprospiraceae bacterium]|nr:hypothetical protein [Saprospiraceae bacterium]